MPSVDAHPVRTLRDHATALEAALAVCLAEPDKRAVHKLRTETRRIEAQIALLKMMRGLPPFRAAAARLLKQSKKLRRAAGNVRDLDVQQKLIKEEAEQVTRDADDRATMQKRFDDLLQSREEVRAHRAQKLLAILVKKQAKLAGALEALLDKLKPAQDRTLGPAELVALVDGAFCATRELRLKAPDGDDLHTIRKAAKRARYQLETAPAAASARRAAKRYEALQDAGGQWHDWLELTALATGELGEHHRITAVFRAECSRHLRSYERLLEQARATLAARPRAAKPGRTATVTAMAAGTTPRKAVPRRKDPAAPDGPVLS